MATEGHHGVRVVAGVDQVPDAAAAQVVDEPVGLPDRRAGCAPRLAEVANRHAATVEDERAVELAGFEAAATS